MSSCDLHKKWDTIESGIENIYILRSVHFEKYFDHDDRPQHWPKAWTRKEVIWDSIGTLWADNNEASEIDQISSEPLLICDASEALLPHVDDVDPTEIIDKTINKVCDETNWDFLVIYFVEDDNNGGFFDGVCTVSFRVPIAGDNAPYLFIGSFATEKSLSESDNEKVTRNLADAVVEFGGKIRVDIQENKTESLWYKDFYEIKKPLMISVAVTSHPNKYTKLINDDAHDDQDFFSFWKNKIGFERASREDNIKVLLTSYKTPLSIENEDKCIDKKKRKTYDTANNSSGSETDDFDTSLEDMQSNIILLVIKPPSCTLSALPKAC